MTRQDLKRKFRGEAAQPKAKKVTAKKEPKAPKTPKVETPAPSPEEVENTPQSEE